MPLPNLKELMKKAKDMQEHMKKIQKEISETVIVGEAGGNLVKVHMNGSHEVLRVEISPELLKDDKEMLEDLVAAACNDAVQKINIKTKSQMQEVTKNIELPDDLLEKMGE